jgi:hypothetical protein
LLAPTELANDAQSIATSAAGAGAGHVDVQHTMLTYRTGQCCSRAEWSTT